MTTTVDTYASRNALPANATHGTIAAVLDANTVTLWMMVAGIGWVPAAHGAAR